MYTSFLQNVPGLEGNETTGERSTMETVLSVPHAQPQSQARSDLAVKRTSERCSTGDAQV
jgi:hypothetical protein